MIDPGYWANMRPFTTDPSVGVPPAYDTRGSQGATGVPDQSAAAQQNPYDWTQAFVEQERQRRAESDKQYQIQLQQLEQSRQRDLVTKGTAEANAAYNRGMLQLSQAKLAEDKRQFDTTTQQAMQQFTLKQQELARQFDTTTAEGKRQFDLASAESKRQFDATFGQRATQFTQDLDFKKSQLTEGARQYDLSRGDQLAQFADSMGLDRAKLAETARQYDLTRVDQREQFLANLAEQHDQFQTTATGYTPTGQATLEREKFGNQALLDWTTKAIDLASNPADWIKYKQMTSGVAGNLANIPGLAWTQGGQQGNTAFNGTPQANSLGNVLGQMGIQQPGQGEVRPGASPPPGGPQPGALSPAEQSRFNEITSRRAALAAAHEGDVSPEDLAELQRYQARGAAQTVIPLSPQEQARAQQIMERQAQQRAAGEAVDPSDAAELARYQARGSQPSAPAGDGSGGYYLRSGAGGAPAGGVADAQPTPSRPGYVDSAALSPMQNPSAMAPAAAPQTQQPVTNWALAAANMIPTGDALRSSLSAPEQQIYDTANEFAKNPQGAASGWYEQQDPMTKELMRGAAQAQGHDWTTVMSRYNRSRWGGGGSAMAA
ncbi:MAG TPA: hypothetical protein VMT30_09205 [Candidatus Saccharimonadia bacterium]|nr:hypothetical protein [Candidatus Saccharimonadia bacterium]